MIGCLLSVILTVIPSAAVPLTAVPLAVIPSQGAFLTPLQQRDSILIADQLFYGFELRGVEEGTQLFFPEIKQEDDKGGPTVLGGWQLDTLKVYRARKGRPASYDLKAGVVITSFDEGNYQLPPLATMRRTPAGDVDTLVFEALTMDVKTLALDEDFEPNDIKGQIRYPLTFKELIPYIAGLWGLATLVILIVCLILAYRRRAGGPLERRDPAHIVALRKLDHYRGDRFWAAEKQKAFYSGVTDALREYIVSRYGVAAMEMTTGEIFAGLKDSDIPADLYKELEGLFRRADFVKFAKYVADRDENAAVLPLAVRFVTTTYQTEVEEEASDDAGTQANPDTAAQATAEAGTRTTTQATTEAGTRTTTQATTDDANGGIPEEHSRWLPKN